MRTTLDLPEELVSEAMKISHSKTKTDVIKLALENLIAIRFSGVENGNCIPPVSISALFTQITWYSCLKSTKVL